MFCVHLKNIYNLLLLQFMYYVFRYLISGNIKLEKWTANSVHRAGLCADHFDTNSFKGEDKKKLKRDAIPIRFKDLIYLQEKAAVEVGETQKTNGEQNKKKRNGRNKKYI